MKKIVVCLVLVLSTLLTSCKINFKFNGELEKSDDSIIEVVLKESTSISLTFKVECKNKKMVEANSIIVYLYKNCGESYKRIIDSKKIDNYSGTCFFSPLSSDTLYDLIIRCTYDGQENYEVAGLQYKTLPLAS